MGKRGWFALDPELDGHMARRGEENTTGVIGRLYERDGVVLTLAAHVDDGDTHHVARSRRRVTSDGTKTDTGVKASDAPPPANAKSATKASDL